MFVLLILLNLDSAYSDNRCYKQDSLPNMRDGFELDSDPFSKTVRRGPMDCARHCKRHSLCQSANLNKHSSVCSLLHTVTGNYITNIDSVVLLVKKWDDDIVDACKGHQCPNNTVCKAENSNHYCEPIGCTGQPNVVNINDTSFSTKALWQFGEIVEYACQQGYYTLTNASCSLDGSWAIFSCVQYSDCNHISTCQIREWKHYWLYLRKIKSIEKIFCRYESYLSLPKYNMASYPPFPRYPHSCNKKTSSWNPEANGMGYTDFEKYRLNLGSSTLSVTDQPYYTNSTHSAQNFGRAGDAYALNDSSLCGVIGHFIIDLRGTGFRVKSTVQWTTWGQYGVIYNITWSDDGQVIKGYCGGLYGGCKPDGDVFLESVPTDRPPFESAELPICRFPLQV